MGLKGMSFFATLLSGAGYARESTADFFKLFIYMQDACGTHKMRLKILDSNFTYHDVYSFCTFGVCLN